MPPTACVQLLPSFAPANLPVPVAVVTDALRATTTTAHALAAGCLAVYPCAEIDEARRLAASLPSPVLLGGERDGRPIPGFDLGNSPGEYTPDRCAGATLV